MVVTPILDALFHHAAPLTSPLLALGMALLVPWVIRRPWRTVWRIALPLAAVGAFWAAYAALCAQPAGARWMAALDTPLAAAYLLLIMPALYLPRTGRLYAFFRAVPALVVVAAALSVVEAYRALPPGRDGFVGCLIRPAALIAAVVSLLILVEPWCGLKRFRTVVRVVCLMVLAFGGFAFRQNLADYDAMLQRRRTATPGIMNLSETSPVLLSDRRMTYLPSAPCRFTADGGYVQGCNLEMAQRFAQINYRSLAARDPAAVNGMALLGGTLVMFMVLSFLGARWFCGWLCPLSTLGGALDAARRALRLPHWKPARGGVRAALVAVGLAVAVAALLMAAAVPYLDAEGKFAGVKIPLYPFCKVCPSQQVCPVVTGGPAAYAGLPTMEWGFGFFKVTCIGLLVVYLAAFLMARRTWCRLCPMGMISGVFNRGGMFRLVKDARKCNRCGMCAEVCPMDIDSVRSEMQSPDVSCYDCVWCLKCVDACPRDGCLSVEHGGVRVTASRFDAEKP